MGSHRTLILTICAVERVHVILVFLTSLFNVTQQAKAFELSYLEKVPEVKDTVHKQSLLHHVCTMVVENFPDSSDLYSEIGAITRSAKVRPWTWRGWLVGLVVGSPASPQRHTAFVSKPFGAACTAFSGVHNDDSFHAISNELLRSFSYLWFLVGFFPTEVCGASLPCKPHSCVHW